MTFKEWFKALYIKTGFVSSSDELRMAWEAATAAEREACAKVVEPRGPRPCDCERCDCGNRDDAESVARWDEAASNAAAIRARSEPCGCRQCRPVTMDDMRMVLCPDCGNKRCPKANDHRNACSGSNEPGQPGSAYP